MKIIKLFLPGKFEDAYVYMSKLIILTENFELRVCDLNEIARHLEDSLEGITPIPRIMFSHNEWLTRAVFRALMKNEEIAKPLLQTFDRFPQPFFNLSEDFLSAEQNLGIQAQVPLDILIYNGRFYMGSNTGLYYQDIEWKRKGAEIKGNLHKRHDASCIGITAGYGSINASCGGDGLFSSIDEFGWTGRASSKMKQVADKSLKTAWLGYNLVNYPTFTHPLLLQNSRQKLKSTVGSFEQDSAVLTEIGKARFDINSFLGEITKDLFHQQGITQDFIQYEFNSNKSLFLQTINGHLYTFTIQQENGGDPEVSLQRTSTGAGDRILSAMPVRSGIVVETYDQVKVFSNGKWYVILDSAALSVRTFSRSKRFRDLVAITTEEGVFLVGLFNESEFT
jgi:hypothetical protein